METTLKIPLQLNARLDLGEEIRVSASWEEFLEVLPDCTYRIEYSEGQIISYIGHASENHEILVATIIQLLGSILNEISTRISGSNLALHVPGTEKRYFNADVTVIEGASERVPLMGSMYAIANPVLLVEVLSTSTLNYDQGEKARYYRQIPSLQQVLFVDSEKLSVISQIRRPADGGWYLQDFNQASDEVEILGQGSLSLERLYEKVKFGD